MTLQIVIPMAGLGSRFTRAGYLRPKPLVDVAGKPMIERVIANLRPTTEHQFVFVVRREHVEAYGMDCLLREAAPGCELVVLEATTEGAACTLLACRDALDPEEPLVVANCDQYIDADLDRYFAAVVDSSNDGVIMTMRASDAKWSYVALDSEGRIARVVEKEVISEIATVGVYGARRCGRFLDAARRMVDADLRVNGEFYVAPVYNLLIAEGARITPYDVEAGPGTGMHGIGTPEDLDAFLRLNLPLVSA